MLLNLYLPKHDDALQRDCRDCRDSALVLLLDPNEARRREVAETLRADSTAVLEAESIDVALAILGGSAPDAAIVNVECPRTNDHDICRRLKSAAQGLLPVLHLAGVGGSRSGWQDKVDLQCDGFLARPVHPLALRAAIRSMVRLKPAGRSPAATSAATSLLRVALDALVDHIALVDTVGEVIGVNQAWIDFASANGYASGETGFGGNYLSVCDAAVGVGSADAHLVAAGLRRVLNDDVEEFSFDYACHAPNKERWYHLSAKRSHDSGRVAALIAHSDRTANHERALSDARFRTFVESTHEGVVAMDADGAITYLNPRMEEILGCPAAGVIGREFADFTDDDPDVRAEYEGVEMRVRRNGRPSMDMLATLSPIVSADGSITGRLAMLTDVTSRKVAERRLADALDEADLDRRRLCAVMEAIPLGVGLAAPSGELTQQNAAVERIWGGTAPKVRSAKDYGLYRAWWPATGAVVKPHEWALARTLATGETIAGEMVEIERFDGTRGFVLNHSASIVGHDGTSLGAVFVLVDITERQLASHERDRLLASLDIERQRLAAVFEHAPAFLAILRGAQHVFERVNPAFQQLIGHRNVIGMPLADALPEIADQGFTELLDHVRDTGEPFMGKQMHVELVRTPGGPLETRYLDFVYQRLDDATGEPTIVAHGVDVTEQVLATHESQRNIRLLREQFVKQPMPTYLWEAKGDDFALVDFNEAAGRAIPRFKTSTLGNLRSDIFGVPTAAAEHLRRALSEDVVLRETIQLDVGPPLGRRMFELEVGPQQPDRLLVHAVDVTDRVALESQLRQAQKLDALGRLAGGIAHDFNNLLGVMLGYVAVITDEVSPDDPIGADLGQLQNAIQRAAALTAQLLAFGRKQPGRARRTDIRRILSSNETFLTRLLAEDISVDVDLDGPEPLYVIVDTSQLEQVVMNLAVNARDAMP
ncbi:MAG: PAS domain-containing protein, partial [bacterium]